MITKKALKITLNPSHSKQKSISKKLEVAQKRKINPRSTNLKSRINTRYIYRVKTSSRVKIKSSRIKVMRMIRMKVLYGLRKV
jgi:mRNA-degrading endonuclease RelE of RelBE toxin-antitoxin system